MTMAHHTPRIPPESEAQFQAFVVDLAKQLGWLCYHAHDSRRSAAGFPDLLMVRGERCIAAELKSARGQTTLDQTVWLGRLGRVPGIEPFVWRPSMKQAILETLR